jgi:hypothetical protein
MHVGHVEPSHLVGGLCCVSANGLLGVLLPTWLPVDKNVEELQSKVDGSIEAPSQFLNTKVLCQKKMSGDLHRE